MVFPFFSFTRIQNSEHPHPDWVSCPRSECWVKKMSIESEIRLKRPCNLCGAKDLDGCACESCFSCDNDGICCDKCPCCDCNNVFLREITEKEWSSYINDHLNVSPGRKKKVSTNISARHQLQCQKYVFLVWTKSRLV